MHFFMAKYLLGPLDSSLAVDPICEFMKGAEFSQEAADAIELARWWARREFSCQYVHPLLAWANLHARLERGELSDLAMAVDGIRRLSIPAMASLFAAEEAAKAMKAEGDRLDVKARVLFSGGSAAKRLRERHDELARDVESLWIENKVLTTIDMWFSQCVEAHEGERELALLTATACACGGGNVPRFSDGSMTPDLS